MTTFPSQKTTDIVYSQIEREADLDGLTISSSKRLGELSGFDQTTANAAVRLLEKQGRVRVIGKHISNTLMIQLPLDTHDPFN